MDVAGDRIDDGILSLADTSGVSAFVGALGKLRVWEREPAVKFGGTPKTKG